MTGLEWTLLGVALLVVALIAAFRLEWQAACREDDEEF